MITQAGTHLVELVTSENRMIRKAPTSLFSSAFGGLNIPPPKANFSLHYLWLQGVWKALYILLHRVRGKKNGIQEFSFFLKRENTVYLKARINLIFQTIRECEVIFKRYKNVKPLNLLHKVTHQSLTQQTSRCILFLPFYIQSSFKADCN